MLAMALAWSRLAEYAAKTAAREPCAELESARPVDGERTQHLGEGQKSESAAVMREAEGDWSRC